MTRHATPADLPEVTDAHRQAAFVAMRWVGWGFNSAMRDPTLRKLIDCRAAQMRTAEWEATTKRTVVPVKRVRLGVDGHPIGWVTQMASGIRTQTNKLDIFNP